MRGRAEVARRAHNPEVVGSNPAPATKKDVSEMRHPFFCKANAMRTTLFTIIALSLIAAGCRFDSGDNPFAGQPAARDTVLMLELPEYGSDEDVLFYSGFTSSYNHETLIPNWVAYELTAEELNPVYTSQSSTFSKDFNVTGRQASREDYSRSGWDKGHMAPKADMRWSEKSYWESHYFTNVCPQNHELNAGDWNVLEKQVRSLARKYGKVYVVCGPFIENASLGTIGDGCVQVPDAFFKALLVYDGKSHYSSCAFVFQNNGRHQRLADYACSVDELEAHIGRNLFAALDAMGLDSIESSVDYNLIHR